MISLSFAHRMEKPFLRRSGDKPEKKDNNLITKGVTHEIVTKNFSSRRAGH